MGGDANRALKEARRALDERRFFDAGELCRGVLCNEPDHYMALVMLGAAHNDDPRALPFFRKAIALKPDGVVALKGLAAFYRRNAREAEPAEVCRLYVTLYRLKACKPDDALNEISRAANDAPACIRALQDLHAMADDPDAKRAFLQRLVDFLVDERRNDPQAISALVQSTDPNLLDDRLLLKHIMNLPRHLRIQFSREILALKASPLIDDCLRNCLNESAVLCGQFSPEQRYAAPCRFPPESLEAVLDDAVSKLHSRRPLDAYLACIDSLKTRNPMMALLCARCCLELRRWCEAEFVARPVTGLDHPEMATCARRISATALCRQTVPARCATGIATFKSLDVPMTVPENVALFYAHLTMNSFAEAEKCLEQLESSDRHVSLAAELLERTGKRDEALRLLEAHKDNEHCLSLLAMYYSSESDRHDNAFTALLMSARCDPHDYALFFRLGLVYLKRERNLEKAKKCFQKSLELNPECTDAAKNLSETYVETADWENNGALLNSVVNQSAYKDRVDYQWAWLRLGQHHIALEQWDDAVINLRTYMRLNSNDPEAWSILADAYHHRGSYTSALKCYQKAVSIDPDRKHCSIQIGTIQCLLQQYDEALESFTSIGDDYLLPSLKGLAEVKLCTSNDLYARSVFGACRDNAQEAIDIMTRAILLQGELTCLWKILYGALMIVAKLPHKYNWLDFNINICFEDVPPDVTKISGAQVHDMVIECIHKSIELRDDSSKYDLYNDLAYAHYNYYEFSRDKSHMVIAHDLLVRCLENERHRWQHWNLMAIVCSSDAVAKFDVAQHCLIKALEMDPVNSTMWSNLGMLYYKLDEKMLANMAFMKAQESNPAYVNSWIGQALIAEAVDETEAIDLYRHASQLTYSTVSSSRYGFGIAKSLCTEAPSSSDEDLNTTHTACDGMAINCNFGKPRAATLNVYGVLLEKLERHKSAIEALQNALKCVDDEHRDVVLSNLGRLYYKDNRYDSAIQTLLKITKFNTKTTLLLALSYLKSGNHSECYASYKNALTMSTTTEREKMEIIRSMACVLFDAKEIESAKLLLYQSIDVERSTENPPITSLVTLFAIAMMSSDTALSQLLTDQLRRMSKDSVITLLNAYMQLKGHDPLEAQTSPLDPDDASLSYLMSRMSSVEGKIESTDSEDAPTVDNRPEMKNSSCLKIAAISEYFAGNVRKSRTLAQKALMLDPSNEDNLFILRTLTNATP